MKRVGRRWVLAAGVGGLVAYAVREYRLIPEAYAGGALTVSQAHARARSGDILLVDIRRPDEWERTGVGQGAHPLDMRRADFTDALRELAAENPDRPIALICARGVRSARLSNQLTNAGFPAIIDVPEGMLGSRAGVGWLGAGLPVDPYQGAR